MEFHLLLLSIFTVLYLTHVASHAALSPQAYWHSVLPNTPMPMAVKNLLPQEANLRRSAMDAVGHIDFAEANVYGGDKDARAIFYNVGRGDKDARAIIYNVGRGDKDARAIIYFAEANVRREDKMQERLFTTWAEGIRMREQLFTTWAERIRMRERLFTTWADGMRMQKQLFILLVRIINYIINKTLKYLLFYFFTLLLSQIHICRLNSSIGFMKSITCLTLIINV
ncbi:hypothetical protein ACSBR2_030270 [Camellia fascicularis]